VITQLRREHYDVVLDLQGNSKSALFTRLSGAVQRYGFSRDGVREWPNLLATNHHVKLTAADHHISDRSMAIARAAFPQGCVTENAGPLPLRPEAVRQVDELLDKLGLTGRRFVVLHYGTTWPTKLWAPINWQELVRRLASATDLVPVLTWGSTGELAVVEQIASVAKGRAVIWPRGSLPELVALLAKAVVVVGGDTGPVHIAAAVGTPTVSLFRVTDASRNAPRGLQHVCLQSSLECSPCLRKSCNRDADCARSITVAEVLAALFKTQLVADQSH
jgi:heptosyltransferase-1